MIDITAFMQTDIFILVIIPVLIFIARIIDVSMGTLRIILISKGYKLWAPVLGFFEVLIWLIAFRQIMLNLTNWITYIAFAAGFAAGTYTGMLLEERLAFGKVLVRIVTKRDASDLLDHLKQENYNVTGIEGEGNTDAVKLILATVRKQKLPKLIGLIKEYNSKAFYSIEDVRYANDEEPIIHAPVPFYRRRYLNLFNFNMKKK